jgi:hypothetical protein
MKIIALRTKWLLAFAVLPFAWLLTTWYVRPATEPTGATIIGLMTMPGSFDTQLVRLTGVMSAEFEDQRLYLAKDFYDYRQREYSVSLTFTEEQLKIAEHMQGRFVIVEGVFFARADRAGAPGRLESINRIEALDEPRIQAR